ACLRYRDVRRARERIRARRDNVDARRRGRLRRPVEKDHERTDPGRGPAVSLAGQLRQDRVHPEEVMRASRLIAALLGGALSVSLTTCSVVADTGSVARSRLANGMTVLVRENPTAPVVGASLMLKMGTRWETRETAGISNFLQLMVVRGTTSLDGTQ